MKITIVFLLFISYNLNGINVANCIYDGKKIFEWMGNKYDQDAVLREYHRRKDDWIRKNRYNRKQVEIFNRGFRTIANLLGSGKISRRADGSWVNTSGVKSTGEMDINIFGGIKRTENNEINLATALLDDIMETMPPIQVQSTTSTQPSQKQAEPSKNTNNTYLFHLIGRINIQYDTKVSFENNYVLIHEQNKIIFYNPETKEEFGGGIIWTKTLSKDKNWDIYECIDKKGQHFHVSIAKYVDMGSQMFVFQGNYNELFILYPADDENLSNVAYRKQHFLEEIGWVLQYYQLYSDALQYYIQAIQEGAKGKGILAAMARCYLETENYSSAINYATQALYATSDKHCDRDEYIYNIRGLAKYKLGKQDYKTDLSKGGVNGQNILKDISKDTPSRPTITNKLKKIPNFKIN